MDLLKPHQADAMLLKEAMLDRQDNSPRPRSIGHRTPEAGYPNLQETLFKKTTFPSHLEHDNVDPDKGDLEVPCGAQRGVSKGGI